METLGRSDNDVLRETVRLFNQPEGLTADMQAMSDEAARARRLARSTTLLAVIAVAVAAYANDRRLSR